MQLKFKKQPEKESPPKERKLKRGRKERAGASSITPVNANKGKRPRFVLIIGDEGAILVYMHGNKVVRRLFAPSPQPTHTEAMVELMQANPNVPVAVLADVLDQQYVRQSFPPVSSLSVNGLVKRRLDRDFQAEDIKGSLPLGRDKTGRKEWNFLLIALANTTLIQQWLDLVVELPNELKGIFLVPVEAQVYLSMIKKALPTPAEAKQIGWQLLVSHNKVSGFRQVVIRDGKLVFTRVSQAIDDAIPAVIAGNIEQEILNTIEYLRRLGFQENVTLEVVAIVSQDVMDALDLKRFGLGAAHVLTPLDVADMLGLEQAALSADRFGDVVMAAAFARARKRILPLSTAYADKLAQLYLIRKAIRGALVLGVLALLGLSGMNIASGMSDGAAAVESDQQRQGLQAQLEVLKKAISGLNKDVAFKAAVMGTYDAYLKNARAPGEFVRDLSAQLTPEQRIAALNWGYDGPSNTPSANADASTNGLLNIKVEFELTGTYPNVEALDKAAQAFIATLKSKLPQYDITAEPFSWAGDIQKGQEVSFDQPTNPNAVKDMKTSITLIFKGPKKLAAAGGTP